MATRCCCHLSTSEHGVTFRRRSLRHLVLTGSQPFGPWNVENKRTARVRRNDAGGAAGERRFEDLPGGRFHGRPPSSAPSDRTTRTPLRPTGSSAPQTRSDPSSPWRRRDVWAPPTSLKTTHKWTREGVETEEDRTSPGLRADPILGSNETQWL